MKLIRWTIGILFLASIAIAIVGWLNSQSIQVEVASVTRGKLVETVIVNGSSSATERTTVVVPSHGILRKITLESGDLVEKDTVLATLDPAPPVLLDQRSRDAILAKESAARSELNRAVKSFNTAESNLKQVQKKRASITAAPGQSRTVTPDLDVEEQSRKRELEAAERVEERARMELNAVLAQLGMDQESGHKNTDDGKSTDTKEALTKDSESPPSKEMIELNAPGQLHVLKVFKADAGIVSAGTPLLELGNLNALEFHFDVLTTEASRLKVGTSVQLRRWSSEDASIQGRVTKIEKSGFRRLSPLGVEEYRTRVTVAPAPGEVVPSNLGDGYKVEGVFQIHESLEAIKVPLGAIFRKEGDWYVFRAINGRAIQTKVELGVRNDRESAIVSGLSDYDLVILFPANRIENGARISIR